MIKYPKTPRLTTLVGSDEMAAWSGLTAVVEEKVDGANAAVSFKNKRLVLQSRGHLLSGGKREALFERMWPWAYERVEDLQKVLGDRYVLFGEWIYAKNRIFYDALPDYFLAFDVYDRETETFLTTPRYQEIARAARVEPIEILWTGKLGRAPAFSSFIGPSRYKTGRWKKAYQVIKDSSIGKRYDDSETDDSLDMEGVYIRVEDDKKVVGRMKVHRPEFEKIRTDDQKWGRRPLFPNQLR